MKESEKEEITHIESDLSGDSEDEEIFLSPEPSKRTQSRKLKKEKILNILHTENGTQLFCFAEFECHGTENIDEVELGTLMLMQIAPPQFDSYYQAKSIYIYIYIKFSTLERLSKR